MFRGWNCNEINKSEFIVIKNNEGENNLVKEKEAFKFVGSEYDPDASQKAWDESKI